MKDEMGGDVPRIGDEKCTKSYEEALGRLRT
jgi:hypothetical protein